MAEGANGVGNGGRANGVGTSVGGKGCAKDVAVGMQSIRLHPARRILRQIGAL
ncbi:hypothetical protein [Paenochrobactrum pullorum]|uniref:hypothetical protein n=1 Tax=Paenochrobactrum pullorum TaxID=1324351 RepID=UPI0035BC85F4